MLEKSKDFYEQLSLDHTKLHIVYESCVPYCDDEDVLKEELKQKYKKTLDRDVYLKQTTIGIHKEDFNFQINGKDVDTYASQGQKRSVLLALKIGMVHMIHKLIDDYPVLLWMMCLVSLMFIEEKNCWSHFQVKCRFLYLLQI